MPQLTKTEQYTRSAKRPTPPKSTPPQHWIKTHVTMGYVRVSGILIQKHKRRGRGTNQSGERRRRQPPRSGREGRMASRAVRCGSCLCLGAPHRRRAHHRRSSDRERTREVRRDRKGRSRTGGFSAGMCLASVIAAGALAARH
jgi:hypothetical protein